MALANHMMGHINSNDADAAPSRGIRRLDGALLGLAAAALAIRIAGAWWMRFHLNPDAGIAALMSRHMALGIDWPVFFYGQAYMGSLEPAVGALFCRLMGVSGFAVALGTAFFALLLPMVMYVWARDAYDKSAGLFAAGFAMIGPQGFFHYNHSPRGGYAATLLLNTLCLWLAARIAARYRQTRGARPLEFAMLGLCAGLGWWTNQLVFAGLLTAALLILCMVGIRALFPAPALCAGAMFLLGSAPFWLYNALNGWPTFTFMNSFSDAGFAPALKLFFTQRLPGVTAVAGGLAVNGLHWMLLAGALALYVRAVIGMRVGRTPAVRPGSAGWLTVAPFHHALWLFCVVSALVFSASHFASFNTSRYLLPLIPALSVMAGIGLARLARFSRPAAWCLAVIILALQAGNIGWARRGAAADALDMARYDKLCAMAMDAGKTNFFGDYFWHSLNFMLDERILAADAGREKYLPYARRIEASDDVGILGDYDNPGVFFERYGGAGECAQVEGVTVHYNLRAPQREFEPIDPADVEYVVDSIGRDVRFLLTNCVLNNAWRSRAKELDDWIEIGFVTNQTPVMLRMFCLERGENPVSWSLEVKDDDDAAWREAIPRTGFKHYYWCGNRIYCRGDHHRFEVFFTLGNVKKLRIRNYPGRADWWWTVRSLSLFKPGAPRTDERAAAADLYAALCGKGVTTVYCDRYIAGKLAALSGGVLNTTRESLLDTVQPAAVGHVCAASGAAFVARREDADLTRRALAQRLVKCGEIPVSPWIVFIVTGDEPVAYGLYWAGFGLFVRDDENSACAIETLLRAQRRLSAGDDDASAAELLRRAMDIYPGFSIHCAPRRVRDWLAGSFDDADAAVSLRRAVLAMTEPAVSAPVRFESGIELLGVDANAINIPPGAPLVMMYYWKLPAGIDCRHLKVFAHFMRDNEMVFQDDHVLPEISPATPMVVLTARNVAAPANLRPGELRVFCGIYDRRTGKRLKPRTALETSERGVFLPVTVAVGAPR